MASKALSLDTVLSQLKLSDTPRSKALAQIEIYANDISGLSIYCDDDIQCVQSNVAPEMLMDHSNNEPIGLALWYADAITVSGRKRLLGINFIPSPAGYVFSAIKFIFEGSVYYCCDDNGMWGKHVQLNIDSVYCINNEFKAMD